MNPTADENNIVSGFIEGKEYKVASEISGRVNTVAVDQGARVTAGQTLIELDHALLDAQREKTGRVRTCQLEPGALQTAEQWIGDRRTSWEQRLDRLGDYLAEPSPKPKRSKK